MNFGAPKGRQKDTKFIILGAKRRRKTHQEIVTNSVSKKLQFWYQNHAKIANIGAKYNNKWCKQTAAKHVWKIIKKHVFAKV